MLLNFLFNSISSNACSLSKVFRFVQGRSMPAVLREVFPRNNANIFMSVEDRFLGARFILTSHSFRFVEGAYPGKRGSASGFARSIKELIVRRSIASLLASDTRPFYRSDIQGRIPFLSAQICFSVQPGHPPIQPGSPQSAGRYRR